MLDGKRILVTGSSDGIGLGIARAMLKSGARVVLNSQFEGMDETVFRELSQIGECYYICADLSTLNGPPEIVRRAHSALGGLDCLVNNAGTFVEAFFPDVRLQDYNKVMDLNVRGYFLASQEFARIVGKRSFDASIISVASTNAIQAEANHVPYDISKGAVLMMTRSMAVDLSRLGIRVNAVGPGLIRTKLSDYGLQSEPAAAEHARKQIPIGRIGEPEDVGGAACFLASDAARYITGQILYVDGGIIAQQMSFELD